ncbi:MAG TPA: xanthine dehydrogenase family protein molybdopterin-binding subunit [Acidimicrobiales bacterium]|nr:xanthine dehydrogenase family protein molybdopterin-binding subunit [Acidimicrobiales bacterium]
MVARLTGQAVPRREDGRLLTGRGRYVDDVRAPGLLHAAFVRSHLAHARLLRVDAAAARAAPGVVAVLTDAELSTYAGDIQPSQMANLVAPPYPALARGTVRMVGEPVALVVAESRYLAEDAAEQVAVEYGPLPPVVDMYAALQPGAPVVFEEAGTNLLHHSETVYGNPEHAFAEAAHVVAEVFHQHRHANVPMEAHGGAALYDPLRGELEYHASHQNPHALRVWLSRILRHPAHRLRVRCGDIGGAFGQKGHLGREDVAVCAAALALGRPVKWVADRAENLVAGGQAREEDLHVRAAVDADGTVRALDVHMVLDQGSYPMCGFASVGYTNLVRALVPAAYRIEHLRFEASVVATNKATYVPYRGPWEAETWLRERILDVVARRTGIDPAELRARNLRDAYPSRMCTGPELINITQRETMAAALARLDYDGWRARQASARAEGRCLGIGVANYVEPAPLAPSVVQAMAGTVAPRTVQQARARLEPDGSVTVWTSQQPHGQGHETTLAQLAADELGVPIDRVTVVHGDTAETPFNMVGTGGSRAATLATGAVTGAVGELRRKMLSVASRLLEIDAGDLTWAEGRASAAGAPSLDVPIDRIAHAVYLTPALALEDAAPGLEATSAYGSGEGTWSQATHCCVVDVDPTTGHVDVLRYVVAEDCGEVINPMIVDGQVSGGVVQGIGAVLLEHSAYSADGQPLATTLLDYLVPTATDVPHIEIVHLDSSGGPRGVGEGGAIGAPAAVTNAIEDALAPFGVVVRDQHLPPARLVALIAAARDRGQEPK